MSKSIITWVTVGTTSFIWLVALGQAFACSQEATIVQETTASQEDILNWYTESNRQRSAGNYQAAIDSGEKVLKQMPDNSGLLIHLGSCHFMLGQMDQAIQYYDRVIEIDADLKPQLWQRGLALYYAGKFKEGQEQFESHQNYNTQDVENAVWHMLCHKQTTNLTTARDALIPIQRDTRVPMKQIHQLYAGTADSSDVLAVANAIESKSSRQEALYYAHLYIGLYQEMTGDTEASIQSMQEAKKVCPIPDRYLMGKVATVHLQLRGGKSNEKDKTDNENESRTESNSEDDNVDK